MISCTSKTWAHEYGNAISFVPQSCPYFIPLDQYITTIKNIGDASGDFSGWVPTTVTHLRPKTNSSFDFTTYEKEWFSVQSNWEKWGGKCILLFQFEGIDPLSLLYLVKVGGHLQKREQWIRYKDGRSQDFLLPFSSRNSFSFNLPQTNAHCISLFANVLSIFHFFSHVSISKNCPKSLKSL